MEQTLSRHLLALSAIVSGTGLVQLANATLTTIIPLRLEAAGNSQESAGLVAAAYSAGFILGCIFSPGTVARVGYIRAFAASAAVSSALALLFDFYDHPAAWMAIRFVMGAAIAALLASADSWISSSASESMRGRVVALYAIVISVAAILSQVLISMLGYSSDAIVTLVGILIIVSIALVCLTRASEPDPGGDVRIELRKVFQTSQVSLLGCVASGMITTGMLTIIPFYLSNNGLDGNVVAMALASLYLGRLVLQWPIGFISDRFDRRWIMLATYIVVSLLFLSMALIAPGEGRALSGSEGPYFEVAAYVGLGLIGGLVFPLYSLCVAHAFDRADGISGISITTTLLMAWATGSIVGPLALTALSTATGDRSAPLGIAGICLALAIFTYSRIRQAPISLTALRSKFSVIPVTSVSMGREVSGIIERQNEENRHET